MSDYEVRDGDVSLFVNDKEGNENRPDLKGYAMVDGVKMNLSLWVKESGKLRFSGRIEEPMTTNGTSKTKSSTRSAEVPF